MKSVDNPWVDKPGDDLSRLLDRADNEYPHDVEAKILRLAAPLLWKRLGPCSCAPPHPRISRECRDWKLERAINRVLEPFGVHLRQLTWPPGETTMGRPAGVKTGRQFNPRPVQLSKRDEEILEYLGSHSPKQTRAKFRELSGKANRSLEYLIARSKRRTKNSTE